MDNVFGEFRDMGVSVYFDNIIIGTEGTKKRHLEVVAIVLRKMKKIRMRADFNKVHITRKSHSIFGWEINGKTKQPAPQIGEVIRRHTEAPTSKGIMVSALALFNFVGSTVPCLADLLAPWRDK
eukprot:Lankesteria_metandrocarpae@DN7184_c0_g1_i1.p1